MADDRGNAYVNSIGFDFPGGEFAAGLVVLVTPDGDVGQVAEGLAFPNGMAITPDGGTLIVAESYGNRLTAATSTATVAWPAAACGRTPLATIRTASAWTPRAPSGTPKSATSTVSGCARAVRCWPPPTWTAAPSLARSAAGKNRACSSSARPMAGPRRRNPAGGSWRSPRPHLVLGDLDPAALGTAPGGPPSPSSSAPTSPIKGRPRETTGTVPIAPICSASNLDGIQQLTAHSGGKALLLEVEWRSRRVRHRACLPGSRRGVLTEWRVSWTLPAIISQRTIFVVWAGLAKADFGSAMSGAQRGAHQILQFCVGDAHSVPGP